MYIVLISLAAVIGALLALMTATSVWQGILVYYASTTAILTLCVMWRAAFSGGIIKFLSAT